MRSYEALLSGLLLATEAKLDKCPGEDRSDDGTCTIDGGFVCLQLLDDHGHPRDFAPAKDWWDITGQARKWDARIRRNGGDSWCVCASCASEIVDKVGCDAMPIRCGATNENDIFGIGLPEYGSLETCLRQKCRFSSSLWDASLDDLQLDLQGSSWVQSTIVLGAALAVAGALILLLRRLFALSSSPRYEPLDTSSDAEGLLDEERFLCDM